MFYRLDMIRMKSNPIFTVVNFLTFPWFLQILSRLFYSNLLFITLKLTL